MKILRYIIFLSILSCIFLVIYRQSDKKGFRRWWMSFKVAVVIAASLAGLIPNPVEATYPYSTNATQPVGMERVEIGEKVEILGKSGKKPQNQRQVIKTNVK